MYARSILDVVHSIVHMLDALMHSAHMLIQPSPHAGVRLFLYEFAQMHGFNKQCAKCLRCVQT